MLQSFQEQQALASSGGYKDKGKDHEMSKQEDYIKLVKALASSGGKVYGELVYRFCNNQDSFPEEKDMDFILGSGIKLRVWYKTEEGRETLCNWIDMTREHLNIFTYKNGTFSVDIETCISVDHPMKDAEASIIQPFCYLYFEMVEDRLELSCPEYMRSSFDEMKAATSLYYKKTRVEETAHVPMSDPGTGCATMEDKVFKIIKIIKHHKGGQVITDIVRDNTIELLIGIGNQFLDNNPGLIDLFEEKI